MDQPLLMSREEAARSLGMSLSHFQRHVQAEMPSVESGQLKLYRRRELETWIDREIDRRGVTLRPTRIRLTDAHERFIADCKAGVALTKRGRPYKPKAIINLDSSLRRLPDSLRLELLDALSRGQIQRAVDEFQREVLSSSRISSIVNALRSLYRWAINREMALEDPAALVQLPACDSKERDRVATPGEFTRLLSGLAPQDALPFALAAYGTARSQEISALDWSDVDLARGVMLLADAEGARKSEAARRLVPIVKPLLVRLGAEWKRQGRPAEGKACPPRKRCRSGSISLGQLQKRVFASWKELNLNPIGLQDCRHTAATWLDHAGVSPKVVSAFMGHKAPRRQAHPEAAPITLRRYTHLLDGELERARDRLDDFLKQREREQEALRGGSPRAESLLPPIASGLPQRR